MEKVTKAVKPAAGPGTTGNIAGKTEVPPVTKAVIPAAGLGTRFLPATKAQPKEMLPIVDKPTIQYIVEEAKASGIKDILIITGRSKRAIEDHFDCSYELEDKLLKSKKKELRKLCLDMKEVSSMVNIYYVRQKHPNGLGGAILCAKTFVGQEPFAVMLGDDVVYTTDTPCLKQLIDVYKKEAGGKSVLGVQQVSRDDIRRYGIAYSKKRDEGKRFFKVRTLKEKPKPETKPFSDIAILGRYIINPKIFDLLEKAKRGVDGEIQLTDSLRKLSKQDGMYAYNFDGIRYDVGTKLGFLKANVEYALRQDELKKEFKAYLTERVLTEE